MPRLEHPYAWLFCTLAALGAYMEGCDGVYFTGVTAIETFIEHSGTQKSGGTYEISSSQLSLMTSVINIGGRKSVFLVRSIMITVRVILQLAADHQAS
jgi:SP family sugar:H+ symporter-like MFS transporter